MAYLRWYVRRGQDPAAGIRHCLDGLEGQTLEIIAHPAIPDRYLPTLSNYVAGRKRELDFLLSQEFDSLLGGGA